MLSINDLMIENVQQLPSSQETEDLQKKSLWTLGSLFFEAIFKLIKTLFLLKRLTDKF